MGTINQIVTTLTCPRCHCDSEMTVDLYFGFRNCIEYQFGDRYQWTRSPLTKNGGSPSDGDMDGEGYTECPSCRKDFWVIVEVRGDIIMKAKPDLSKKPYIPD